MLFLLSLISFLGYFWTNRRPAKYYFESKLDKKIKLIPIFIVPYVSYYFLIIFSYFVLSKTTDSNLFFISTIIANFTATIFWYFLPNGVKRPKIKATGPLSKILAWIYQNDGDSNGFPSAHVYISLISIYYFLLRFSDHRAFFFIWCLLILLSTIFTKQHYVIDILGGIIFAIFALMLAPPIAFFLSNLL